MIGAGGTPGGTGQFLLGLGMAVVGAYLLTQQVTVSSGGWALWGYNSFGLSLVPFVLGIGVLFFDGRSRAGWWLLYAGLLIIFAGMLINLNVYFQPTSLFNTLMMLGLLAAGLGLVVRALAAR
jgi:predicted membrane channel-forming protein YqfA (hemolysin III family)